MYSILLTNLGQNLETNIEKISKGLENNSISFLRNNLDYIKELLSGINSQICNSSNKKEVKELIKSLLDTTAPKSIELEIKMLIKTLSLEFEKIEESQKDLQALLKMIQ